MDHAPSGRSAASSSLRRGLIPIKAPIAHLPTFPSMRRILVPLGAVALAAVVIVGLRSADGGADDFRDRLRELKGYPVVVNKWASWCGPCRREFPLFQVQALDRGKEIAFIGVNSADNRSDAEQFIEEFPVSYPHYEDPDSEIAIVFKGGGPFPITAFYDAEGELAHVKYGEYRSEGDLVEEIERYAK